MYVFLTTSTTEPLTVHAHCSDCTSYVLYHPSDLQYIHRLVTSLVGTVPLLCKFDGPSIAQLLKICFTVVDGLGRGTGFPSHQH